MPVNVEKTNAFAALAKSFASSYEARDQLASALREHLGVTPRDSFWMSDDGIDDMLGPVVIYQFNRDVFDGNGGLPVKGSPGSADSFFRATYARTADGFTFGEPVAVRRKTDYVRDSADDEGAEPDGDEAELPAWLAEALARAAGLVKGAGHRYIRRVPKAGGGYRYFYKVSGGKGLGHGDEMQVGAKFRVTNGGKDGHFEIVGKNENGTLRIKHDESGHESVVSPLALRSMLRAEHAQSLTAHREKLAADIKAADDPKAKARLLAEAGKYEHTRDLAEPEKPSAKVLDFPVKPRGGSFHERAAAALGWSVKDAQSMSLQALRDNLRTVAPDLADEATHQISSGKVVQGAALTTPAKEGMSWLGDPNDWKTGLRPGDEAPTPKKPEPDKDSLRNELSTLRSKVAVPDKVFMPAGWNPTAHRAKFAKEHERIDQIEEALGQKYWQRDPARVRSVEGMPERKHREIVKTAALAGKPVPADVIAAHPGLADEIASAKSPAATPGDHTKLYNWGSTYEHPTARATQTAARTMTVGDRDYQLVPQPRPGKAPGFVANASMPGRAGSLDAKGNMTAEAPHVFDTAADAHAAVVKHEAERDRLAAKGRSNRERLSMAPMASSPLPPPQGAKPDPRDDWHRDHGHLADRIVAGDMSAGPNGGVQARYKTHEVDGKTKPVSGEIHGQYGVHQSDMGDDRIGRDPKYKVTHLPTGKGLGPEMSETDAHKLAQTFDSKHKHAGGDVPVGGSIDAGEFKKMSATFKKFMQARQNERDKVQKSMSTVTDPERDFAKSLATSHRTAAQAQPDSGAKAAHESAAQACDAAALAGSTGEFRKALGASERIGGLIKAWTGIPVQQRPPFDDFRKSMTSPTQARPFAFSANNGSGDALGQMGRAVAAARPAVEQVERIAAEPTTYSAQRGAVNSLRKGMGAFYGQLAAGAAQQMVQGVRFPPEAQA